MMFITGPTKAIVASEFIGINDSGRENVLPDVRHKSAGFHIRDHGSDYPAFPLYHSLNNGFPFCTTSAFAPPTPAEVGFIGLNPAVKRVVAFFEKLLDLSKHAPRGLVSNSQFSLELFGRNTGSCRSNQKGSIEPVFQRRPGLVINSTSGRMDVVPTMVTTIGFT